MAANPTRWLTGTFLKSGERAPEPATEAGRAQLERRSVTRALIRLGIWGVLILLIIAISQALSSTGFWNALHQLLRVFGGSLLIAAGSVMSGGLLGFLSVSYTHLTLPTIYSV